MEDLRLIRSFLTVVAQGNNFSAAARELSVTPAAISKNIKRLEETLGIRVFHRNTRSLSLTPEGRLVFDKYTIAMEQIEQARRLAAARGSDNRGLIRITMTRSFGRHVVMPVLQEFLTVYPDIDLDVSLDDHLTDIIRDGFDVGVRGGPHPDGGSYIIRKLAPLQPLVCAAPTYLKRQGEPGHPDELVHHNCILWKHPLTGRPFPWEFKVGGKTVTTEATGSWQCSDLEAVHDLILRGAGLGIVASYRAAPLIAAGKLREVLADHRPPARHYYIHYPHRELQAKRVRLLVDFLLERIPRQSRAWL